MRARKSFTLIELIIAMAIISMVLAAVFMAFSIALRLFVDELARSSTYMEADRGMSRITKDLKSAREIVSGTSREVYFWLSDLNGDGTREADETVLFSWSGSPESSLIRTISGETLPVAYGVRGLTITYDNPSSPKLITIKLTIGHDTNIATLESSVRLRNL